VLRAYPVITITIVLGTGVFRAKTSTTIFRLQGVLIFSGFHCSSVLNDSPYAPWFLHQDPPKYSTSFAWTHTWIASAKQFHNLEIREIKIIKMLSE
jgi:hypothetical protein